MFDVAHAEVCQRMMLVVLKPLGNNSDAERDSWVMCADDFREARMWTEAIEAHGAISGKRNFQRSLSSAAKLTAAAAARG